MIGRRVLLLAVTIAAAESAIAQQTRPSPADAEAIIYQNRNYSGSAVNVSRERADLGLRWPVNSLRLVRGQMELCSAPNFGGVCVTAAQSYTDLRALGLPGNRVQSMRPVSGVVTLPGAVSPGGVGPTLQGMAAQFYARPADGGGRVQACPRGSASAACAKESAEAFCKSQGYNYAPYVNMETQSGVVYLADVLCSRRAA
jgi:hypothetical protein